MTYVAAKFFQISSTKFTSKTDYLPLCTTSGYQFKWMKSIDEVHMERDSYFLCCRYVVAEFQGNHKLHSIFVQLTCTHRLY